jgi:hypothetical protein
MSRYRVTERELLEQVRQEGRMKDIYTMAFDGDSAESIAKKLKLDVATVKKVLGEMFTKKDFLDNEKDNEHSKNALELAKKYGTSQDVEKMNQIIRFAKSRGFINKPMFDIQTAITRKYYPKLKEELELKEFNPDFGKDTKAGRTKETHADDKKTKDEDRIKSLENEIQRLKLELENEKNATVKPEPNPDTGEVPLTVGVAHKYLKEKQKKEVKKEEVELNEKEEFHLFDNKKDAEKKAKEIGGKVIDGTAYRAGHYAVYKGKSVKEELEEATFSRAMISQLKKAYGNLKTITPDNAKKLNKILDTVTKDGLIDLYKAKIPFVSIGAGGKLSQKHNLSPKDINRIISKEEVQEEVELTEYFATVHSDKTQIADFIKKNKKDIDYVDDDAGGNIEFEGKGAHELADKVKAKFGVRVTKESFEPIEDKSLSLDEDKHTLPSMRVPMTVQYTYGRNPFSFMDALTNTKAGKKLKSVFPRKMGSGVYTLKGTGQDHIDFLKVLNNKGIMPKNKIIGEELEEDTNKYITEKIKGLENKAKKSGMPYSILKKVYDRGMAAWKGGHRPGATQQQWAFARVNSFVTKSSGTWGKADKDLADKVRASKKEEVEESRQLKDKEKEMMVVKNGKVIVIDKDEFDKYKSKGYMAAEDIEEDGPCWKTHKQVGMKKKNGRMVPNCVPKNEELEEGFSSDAQRRAAFASGYKAKGKDKKEELDKDDKPLVKKVADMLKKASKKHASQSKMLDKAVNEADLTDKQVKMVRKVADKLPKDDFKKRYGKDADNVKFGTATNIVKKKLKIDEYEGARTLVDRLLKQERGDE